MGKKAKLVDTFLLLSLSNLESKTLLLKHFKIFFPTPADPTLICGSNFSFFFDDLAFPFKSTHNSQFLIFFSPTLQLLTILCISVKEKSSKRTFFFLKMSERFDPSIKLFGKMIQLGFNKDEDLLIGSRIQPFTDVSASTDDDFYFDSESVSSDQNILCSKQRKNRGIQEATKEKSMDTKQERQHNSTSLLEEPKTPTSPSTNTTKNPKTIIKHKMSLSQDHSDQASSNSKSQNETNLKKPDKILSCASSITTQNSKECSWTAGGSMRNVPVGAGTRKCKNSEASLDRHLVIPDGLIRHNTRHDETVFAFGLDSPLENQAKPNMLQLGEGSQTVVSNRVFRSENDKKTPISLSNSNSICNEKGENCTPNSTSLGKHYREDLKKGALKQNEVENSRVVIPKTLRFDDPFETSKSSIWTNPDTKNNHVGSSNGRLAFFGGLQQAKGVNYDRRNVNQSFEGSSMVLQANPAAFLRSLALHEIAQ